MPFSEFTRMVKCAAMLNAQDKLTDISVANFASLVENDRETFSRNLKATSTQFIEVKMKDYREVLGNLARKMMNVSR
jgi:IS1 family transposase